MSELQQQAPHALERILDLIDTMPDGREHTFVPCADLRLLRTAFAALLAERDEARSSLANAEWHAANRLVEQIMAEASEIPHGERFVGGGLDGASKYNVYRYAVDLVVRFRASTSETP